MIYFDSDGFPVDRTGDGGDSAVRSGLLETFSPLQFPDFPDYTDASGLLVRHPKQTPWNNPRNFSRDQLIVKMAGLRARGSQTLARRIFWSHLRRLFFCQNIERDQPGSRKFPWPHRIRIGDEKDIGRWRFFDYRDILMPDHIWHLVRCAGFRWQSALAMIGAPFLFFSILIHSQTGHKEHNQLICQCQVAGPWALRLFRQVVPDWQADLRRYWRARDEIEYADLIIRAIEPV
jgi:hypothetical protein